jgi:uncharacterized protein YlxW (UPF0749 family)
MVESPALRFLLECWFLATAWCVTLCPQVKARMADLERRAAAAMEAAAAAEREQRTVAAQLQEQQAALAARLDELSSRTTAAQVGVWLIT